MNRGEIERLEVSAEPKALNVSFAGDPEGYAVLLEIGVRLHMEDGPAANTTFKMWADHGNPNLRYLYPNSVGIGEYALAEEVPEENGETRPKFSGMPQTWAALFWKEAEARRKAEQRALDAEERLAGVRGLVGEGSS